MVCPVYDFTEQPLLFSLGWVDLGLICSISTPTRSIFLMMSSTVALQMNGLRSVSGDVIEEAISCRDNMAIGNRQHCFP